MAQQDLGRVFSVVLWWKESVGIRGQDDSFQVKLLHSKIWYQVRAACSLASTYRSGTHWAYIGNHWNWLWRHLRKLADAFRPNCLAPNDGAPGVNTWLIMVSRICFLQVLSWSSLPTTFPYEWSRCPRRILFQIRQTDTYSHLPIPGTDLFTQM